MEAMNLLDITIKYFNIIVFVACVLFGIISFFASWIAWREIIHKRNIMRSIIAAYNITEDTLEKGRTRTGEIELDPAIVQTVFNSLQEVLNAMYGEIAGRPIPAREDRAHGDKKKGGLRSLTRFMGRKHPEERPMDAEHEVPALMPEEKDQHQSLSAP